ncbi:torso-like protein [Frankliniella occidentalis]|uniref:Torso-like protein n=1 Tax=Frankliniella occidentalis TaxID=133901 RepID=A0A9C6XB25_FRAOC|nr:torso-like protein [Frankliniella occidentalis]
MRRGPRGLWLAAASLLGAVLLCSAARAAAASSLHTGAAINVFSRYGYFAISMRVVPRNETDRWIFREPSVNVFKNITALPPRLPSAAARHNGRVPVFEGDFHMEFCDNLRQLLQAYFRDFQVERLERPWSAFTASWSRNAMAKHLGLNATYVAGSHCYVLVRVARHRESGRMAPAQPGVPVEDFVAKDRDLVVPGDTESVVEWVKSFGSHYVTSYVTGNSLYQVFVYTPHIYRRIKERLKTQGVAALSAVELASYFSPWYAEHMGRIQSASGNYTVEAWAASQLLVKFYFFTYPSLIKLHGDVGLLKTLDGLLQNEAVLQLDLRTLAPVFQSPERRHWFNEVVDNQLKLWEVNMS